MSIEYLNAALNLQLDDSSAKAVLVGLANHTSPDGECWPGISRLRRYTGLSERAIRDAVRRLEALGLVVTTPRKDPKNPKLNLSNHYRLTLLDAGGVGQELPQGGAGAAPGVGQELPGNHHKNHQQASDARASIAEGWLPDIPVYRWAEEHYPDVDIDHQIQLFIDHNNGKGTVLANPNSAFKNWMRRIDSLSIPPKKRSTGQRCAGAAPGASGADRIAFLESKIKTYRLLHRDYEIEHEIMPELRRLRAQQGEDDHAPQ